MAQEQTACWVCPASPVGDSSPFAFRGNAGPDPEPSDHLPRVAQTPCPPAPVLAEATSLQKLQPGSASWPTWPLLSPLQAAYCQTFQVPSTPFLSPPPAPLSLIICLSHEPAPSHGSCPAPPHGQCWLGGQRGLSQEREKLRAAGLHPPLTPGCAPCLPAPCRAAF